MTLLKEDGGLGIDQTKEDMPVLLTCPLFNSHYTLELSSTNTSLPSASTKIVT